MGGLSKYDGPFPLLVTTKETYGDLDGVLPRGTGVLVRNSTQHLARCLQHACRTIWTQFKDMIQIHQLVVSSGRLGIGCSLAAANTAPAHIACNTNRLQVVDSSCCNMSEF